MRVRARWACCVFGLLWLCWPAPLPALNLSESEQTALLVSLRAAERSLAELVTLSTTQRLKSAELGLRLEQMQQQLSTLDAKLELWQEHSRELETSLERSGSELIEARSSLVELTRRYAGLLRSWSAYRLEMQTQAAARELAVRRWRIVTVVGIPAGALLGALLGVILNPG